MAVRITNGKVAKTVVSIGDGLLDSQTEGLNAFPHFIYIGDEDPHVRAGAALMSRQVRALLGGEPSGH